MNSPPRPIKEDLPEDENLNPVEAVVTDPLRGVRASSGVNKAKSTEVEFSRLKNLVPSISRKQSVSQLDVILEAIRYIDSLQDQLIEQIQDRRLPVQAAEFLVGKENTIKVDSQQQFKTKKEEKWWATKLNKLNPWSLSRKCTNCFLPTYYYFGGVCWRWNQNCCDIPFHILRLFSSAGRWQTIGLGWGRISKTTFFWMMSFWSWFFSISAARQLVFLNALSWAIMSVIYCNKTIIMC